MVTYWNFTRICALLCVLVGLSGFVYGTWMMVDIAGKYLCGERVEADVVRSVRQYRSGGRTSGLWYSEITVRYTDGQGRVHEAMPPINDGKLRLAGEKVAIYCDAENPEDIILDARASCYAPTVIPYAIGLIFLSGACLLWRDCNKHRKTSHRARRG